MANPVVSNTVRSSHNPPRSPGQFLRPTCLPGTDILDRPPTTISPLLTTFTPMTTISPNPPSSRAARLMSTPRIRSKLSTLCYDSSDMDSNDVDSLSTSDGSSDSELDSSSRKPPPRKPTVSRLSFPFVKSAKSPPPGKAVNPISSSLPSTPCTSSRPVLPSASSSKRDAGSPPSPPTASLPFSCHPHFNPQRHNYRHRGYSRHALAHVKWFWAMREEDWEAKSGPVRTNKPQLDESFLETALDDPLASFFNSSGRKRKTPMHPVHQPQHELPPMTIHPRRGDLSALRDPYCTQIDRTFVNLPTWTIGKTLWMYDVHLALQDHARVDVESHDVLDAYETESESESLDTAASSVGYSDDSDATLVDSETETDLSPEGSGISSHDAMRNQDAGEKHFLPTRVTYSSSSSSIGGRGPAHTWSDTSLVPPSPHKMTWSHSAYSEPSTPVIAGNSKKTLARSSSWATDWYRRWECMIEVSHREHLADGKHTFFIGQDAGEAAECVLGL